MLYSTLEECRNCGSGEFAEIIDLGEIFPSDFVLSDEDIEGAPLVLIRCEICDLVQLGHTVDLDKMYREYWYKSSLNASMVRSLQDIVDSIQSRVRLEDGDYVVDIGCNDGTMLDMFPSYVRKVGFDPALNLMKDSSGKADFLIPKYFSKEDYYFQEKAKVVTAIAMFYDLPNPNKFLADVRNIIDDDGLFVVQFTDLLSMLKINAFDNICHEHLEYYSFFVLNNMFNNNSFTIYDISINDVNGGSVRAYAKPTESVMPADIRDSVADYANSEAQYLSSFDDPYMAFSRRIDQHRRTLRSFLHSQVAVNKKIFVLGASTKGNTLLQYYGIDSGIAPYAAEVNSDKFGRKIVSTGIEIISEDQAIEMHPDYFLVLPWHFIESFIENNKILDKGISLICPLPEPIVYYKMGNEIMKAFL